MTKKSRLAAAGVAIVMAALMLGAAQAGPDTNKKLVEAAMIELFVKRDASAIERYWGKPFIQHNPRVANNGEALQAIITSMPATFTYEPGMVVAEGDLVMIHGRYSGWRPKPMIAVDIFRVKDGKLVEHWDVLQEEVPASETKSGNPMFEPGK